MLRMMLSSKPQPSFSSLAVVKSTSLSLSSSSACAGSTLASWPTWDATWSGDTIKPYIALSAESAGKIARKAKKATPPATSETWSLPSDLKTRFVISHHPGGGISAGLSAFAPG
jgi:hypothetical protein